MSKTEIVTIVLAGLALFVLVKYTAVKVWQVLLIMVAGVFLSVYVPQLPDAVSQVASWIAHHATSLSRH